MARTSNTGDTSSEDPEQQAQRKEKYNKSKRPFSSIDHCHPYRRKRMVCACECACCCCTCDVVNYVRAYAKRTSVRDGKDAHAAEMVAAQRRMRKLPDLKLLIWQDPKKLVNS